MAYSSSPPKSRPASPEEGTLFLTALLAFLAVGGLAKWAERSPTVLAALDWLTMPVVQTVAAHAPGFDHFLRQARPFTWYMIEAAMVVLPLFAAVGFYLLLTADTRRRKRMARRQIMAERENAEVRQIKEAMDTKVQARRKSGSSNGGSQPPGSPAVSHEQLKEVFRRQPPRG